MYINGIQPVNKKIHVDLITGRYFEPGGVRKMYSILRREICQHSGINTKIILLLLQNIYIALNLVNALGAEHSTILNFVHRNIQGTPVQTRRS